MAKEGNTTKETTARVIDFPTPSDKAFRERVGAEFRESATRYMKLVDALSESIHRDLLNYHIGVLNNALMDIFGHSKDVKAKELEIPKIIHDIADFRNDQEKPGMLKTCLQHIVDNINHYAVTGEIIRVTDLLDRFSQEIWDA